MNRLLNVRLKHEWLEDTNALAPARYRGYCGNVGQLIITMKSKGIPILTGVEQGFEKNSSRKCLHYKPNMAEEAKE